ncbi:hypothetical protein H257_10656 [Aphanomyces astaci]|uniref:Myb-like domain-containing protein n=1 Tax=Aphanomyces astaci TaxID=112090 RepID=W4G722_APHAT|nr:hypothetical protein H257_10656 [Aphanomyces astaci]ETV75056.1 hypothetical protein H257_10656 [Aphanomyces astaci]|eukprot:XP_009835560.1 hypothetical protein H257_10656 [Aphanomyces astaci]
MSDDASTTRANTRNMRPQSSKRVKSTARRATDQAHEDEPGSNDVVLADLSPEERTMRSPPTANAKTWWSEDDDLLLLIQTNIERPFLALKNKMMAWNDTAAGCMRIDGFGRKSLNGKKASQRFQLLLENHRNGEDSPAGRIARADGRQQGCQGRAACGRGSWQGEESERYGVDSGRSDAASGEAQEC